MGAWDIESSPLTVETWSLWPNAISIEQIRDSQEMICFAWQWAGEKRVQFYSVFHDGKQGMLEAAHRLLDEADAVVSWNGTGYDSKHARREMLKAKMLPPSPYKEIDLMKAVKKCFAFASNKLQHVSTELGLPGKHNVNYELWLACMAGDEKAWRKMKRYCSQDVRLLLPLYDRLLPWLPGHPNVALFDDLRDACPRCGSEELRREGYALTNAGKFQRYQCLNCGAWSRSSRRIATTELREVAA